MIRKSKLYTATGDKGQTSLAGGTRVAKDDIRIEAYGSVDELNAFIGLLDNLHNIPGDLKDFLRVVQNKLFNIGAYLATPDAATARGLDAADVERLERAIDLLDAELPPYTLQPTFLLDLTSVPLFDIPHTTTTRLHNASI